MYLAHGAHSDESNSFRAHLTPHHAHSIRAPRSRAVCKCSAECGSAEAESAYVGTDINLKVDRRFFFGLRYGMMKKKTHRQRAKTRNASRWYFVGV